MANSGTIGTLTNSGHIIGSVLGVFNAGTLALINNAPGGTIVGSQQSGLQNTASGKIVTMSNAGIIDGGSYGIENYGAIMTLTNVGTIGAGRIAAIYNYFDGSSHAGHIGALDNSGTIIGASGVAAITSGGPGATIGPVTNSGLIFGPILIENQDLNIVGGSGTIFGTLAGGTISVLNGNLTFSSGNQLLDDDILVSSAKGIAGGGAVINAGLVQVNTPHSITGAYNQTSGGTLIIGIGGTSPGQYGRLTSSGTATFAGSLGVTTLGRFAPPVGSVYNVVLATGGVQGSFGSLVQPSAGLTSGTHFDTLYSPTTLNLYVTPASYTQLPALGVAETAGEAAVGQGIDALRGITGQRLDPSTSAMLDVLYRLPATAIPPALDGLNNNIYGDLLFAGIERNRNFAGTMTGQTAADRGFAAPAGASTQQIGPLTLWITGTGEAGSVNGSTGRWSENSGGGAIGAGRQMGDFTLGIAVGSSGGSLSAGSQSAATQSVSLGLYGGWQRGSWFVDGDLDVFGTDDTTTRTIPLGDLSARGHARGAGAGGGVETGMMLRAGAVNFEPFVALHVDYLNRSASTEEGAGVFDETIAAGSATSVRPSIGVRSETTISLGGLKLTPSASLAWAHELGDVTTTTSAGFGGGPAVLTLSSQNGGRDAAVIGIGARTPITDRLGIYARYMADLRQDATSQVFSAGLRWVW